MSAMLTIMCVVALLATGYAQIAPGDFPDDPDKTMASDHESFLKKDTNKGAEEIHKAAETVKKEADKCRQRHQGRGRRGRRRPGQART